ncbi:MAG: hypothetical protein JNK72_17065 [Myxococcales bacterium]|nr:hypothetical protein [Myxococcales bacterium]
MAVQQSRQIGLFLSRALVGSPWLEARWGESGQRCAEATLKALRAWLPSESIETALTAADTAARAATPLAPPSLQEGWFRATLVWSARAMVIEAERSVSLSERVDALLYAADFAEAVSRWPLTQLGLSGAPFESLVEASREAFSTARDDVDPRTAEGPFLIAWLHQLKHVASLLAVNSHGVDELMRGAVLRTERVLSRESGGVWRGLSRAEQQRHLRRGVVECAWALAARVTHHHHRTPQGPAVALWLARTSTVLVARFSNSEHWLPDGAGAAVVPPVLPPVLGPSRVSTAKRAAPVVSGNSLTEAPSAPTFLERTMNEKITPVLKTLEADAGEAAWRLAGSQFVKLAREPIVALLSRHLAPDDASLRARIAMFLETELGTSLLSALLSVGLQALPVSQGEVTTRLARELRVRAMAGAGDVVADVLMGPLRQVAAMYLQGAPGAVSAAPSEPAALPLHAAVESLKQQAEAMRDAVAPAVEGHAL